ncbi:methyltransferase domain-containing protein [Oceanobacillus piezotolerans]|uniref:Methyltransferase domain-containing protein n=1 Tax=Oceanobacillus piezotolerans TaxID=2448030 RepID=A0A498DBU8_9BACI|nr:methyltransferase domain-containing protein [Oceanobacillus piezotolerans]RLL48501.1 methyltransferase domain-containing protein [Oceanobacillus piezotolerans]
MIQKWLGNQLKQPKGFLSKWIGIYMQRGNDTINRWTTDLLEIEENEVIVFSVHNLYFWTDINQGFAEVHRVLKPGGKLFLSITDKSQMEKMRRTKNFILLNTEEIEEMIVNHRFQTVKLHQKEPYWCIEATK